MSSSEGGQGDRDLSGVVTYDNVIIEVALCQDKHGNKVQQEFII